MRKLITKATIKFDENGKPEWSKINAKMQIEIAKDWVDNHQNMFSGENEKKIEMASQFMLSTLFSEMTKAGLCDMEKTDIINQVDYIKREDGTIDKCTIKYYLVSK